MDHTGGSDHYDLPDLSYLPVRARMRGSSDGSDDYYHSLLAVPARGRPRPLAAGQTGGKYEKM